MRIVAILGSAFLSLACCELASAQPKSKGKPFIEPPTVHCLVLSPDGKTLALAERAGDIRLWSVADRKDVRAFPLGVINGPMGSYISTLAFSRQEDVGRRRQRAVGGLGR